MTSLRKWFNPIEDIQRKSIEHRDMPFFAAYKDDDVIGFIAIKIHNKYTAEIYNVGVLEEYHRNGIGSKLLLETENYLKENGYKFLTVKTLDESVEYEPYERTRAFYYKNGFYPIEVFLLYWNEDNPCLLLAKYIG